MSSLPERETGGQGLPMRATTTAHSHSHSHSQAPRQAFDADSQAASCNLHETPFSARGWAEDTRSPSHAMT